MNSRIEKAVTILSSREESHNRERSFCCGMLKNHSTIRDNAVTIELYRYYGEGAFPQGQWGMQKINYCPWCRELVGEKTQDEIEPMKIIVYKSDSKSDLWSCKVDKFCCQTLKDHTYCIPNDSRFARADYSYKLDWFFTEHRGDKVFGLPEPRLWAQVRNYDPEGWSPKWIFCRIKYCPWCSGQIEVEVKE